MVVDLTILIIILFLVKGMYGIQRLCRCEILAIVLVFDGKEIDLGFGLMPQSIYYLKAISRLSLGITKLYSRTGLLRNMP